MFEKYKDFIIFCLVYLEMRKLNNFEFSLIFVKFLLYNKLDAKLAV